ncbi:MAG TPA: nucleotidyltransferase domain-containing protein [Candidatus Hypogeohydataceae bacterium YC38]
MPYPTKRPKKRDQLPKRLKKIIQELEDYDPERVILFGSAAREEEDAYSDIDLVVVKKTEKPFLERLVEVALLISEINADIFVYTPEEFHRMKEEENSFIEQVLREGKVIYEKTQGGGPKMARPGKTQPRGGQKS